MVKVKRLVYLPDPTVKFYSPIEDMMEGDYEIYCDYDGAVYLHLLLTKKDELVVSTKKDIFLRLRGKFRKNNPRQYSNPYFTNLSNILSHYEVMTFEE